MRYYLFLSYVTLIIHATTDTATYLFSHGLIANHKQAYRYMPKDAQPINILGKPLITFDYPHACNNYFRINRWQSSLAQENEIEHLAGHFFAGTSDEPLVLMGVSCGASVLVNFMAMYKPANVAALILESPFDCIETIVEHVLTKGCLSWLPLSPCFCHKHVSKIFCKYNHKGISPAASAPSLALDLPILLICSQKDTVVPYHSTLNLYKILRNTGHDKTHILILPCGKHAHLIKDAEYKDLYIDVTHAFYKKYGLSYNESAAERGQPVFDLTQPHL